MRFLKISILLILLFIGKIAPSQIFPVYFVDVINEGNKKMLYFEWRPDYKSYQKAVITDKYGQVVSEVKYPDNTFDLRGVSAGDFLFVSAIGNNGEKSEAVKIDLKKDYRKLYASGPPEQIVIKKQQKHNAKFVGTKSGKEFIIKGGKLLWYPFGRSRLF